MIVPWIKRHDLVIQPHDAGGWVVKDPLTLQFSLLSQLELNILNLLDGQLTFTQLLARARQLSGTSLSAEELVDFIASLASGELIRQTVIGDSKRMSPRAEGLLQIIAPLFRILRFQIRLLNPTGLLNRVVPAVNWLLAYGALRVFALCLIVGLLTAIVRFDELVTTLSSNQFLFGPQNLSLMLVVFVVVKVLHEFGHAIAARLFGAECTECGVMMMVFTPVLYTNVSDTWRLPARQRMIVTAAGIMVELVLASVCLVLWTLAAPGLTRNLLFNTVLICSVNTVLFNGNPLLRFDGYFILTDWARIPNLASQAGNLVRDAVISALTGRNRNIRNRPHSGFLLSYGIAAACYRLFLTLAILQLVVGVAEEWRLEVVGAILAIIIVTGFLIIPAAAFMSEIAQENASAPFRIGSWIRLTVTATCAIALLIVPIPSSIVLPAFVIPEATPVYAAYSGRIGPMIAYGDHVEPHQEITQLLNHELAFRRSELQARADLLAVDLENLEKLQNQESADQIPGLEKSLLAARERVDRFDTETAGLKVLSPRDGILLPPPVRAPLKRPDLPELWDGLPGSKINVGAWIERGTHLGSIGHPGKIQLQIAVSETSVELLEVGQQIAFWSEGSDALVYGILESVNPLESETLAPQFAAARMIAGQATDESLRPSETTYLATATLSESPTNIALYRMGTVRVQLEKTSLLWRFLRYLRQTF